MCDGGVIWVWGCEPSHILWGLVGLMVSHGVTYRERVGSAGTDMWRGGLREMIGGTRYPNVMHEFNMLPNNMHN